LIKQQIGLKDKYIYVAFVINLWKNHAEHLHNELICPLKSDPPKTIEYDPFWSDL
jgi:hypothetical protein